MVDCNVTARLQRRGDLWTSAQTSYGSDVLYVSYGYGRTWVSVSVRPRRISLEPIVRVQLTDVGCRYHR